MKIKNLLGMAVVALMAAACTNDADDVLAPEGPSQESIHFKATMSPKKIEATTRALITENDDGSLSSEWEEGDIVFLEYETNFRHVTTEAKVIEVSPTGYATIQAELDKSTIDGSDVDVWFNMEKNKYDGTLSTELEIRKGSSTLKVEDGVASLVGPVELEPLCAIVKFTIEDMTGKATAMKPFVIEIGSDKSITIDPTEANSILYMALPPMEDQTLWFTATDSDDKPYIAKATGNLKAGYFYQVSLKMATLGDLMNSDGTFSATAEEGKTPIGVIAYLGNDNYTENGTMVGGSKFAGHGLAMALKNAASQIAWGLNTSEWRFGEDARVNSLDALHRTTDVSGYSNTKSLTDETNAENRFPAAYAAWNYKPTAPTGTTGWFLPSAQQWVKMMTGLGGLSKDDIQWMSWFDNNYTCSNKWEKALKKAGEGNYESMTEFLWYWSSSEYSDAYAVEVRIGTSVNGVEYGFYMGNGAKSDKVSTNRVRPILAF